MRSILEMFDLIKQRNAYKAVAEDLAMEVAKATEELSVARGFKHPEVERKRMKARAGEILNECYKRHFK